ncbi:MAG: ABC transporter permease subunit [candidate division Zixibacteria bacterium]|nr:ABC transporter permease subunit [candidate division Zixibacteria bacterium]
MLKVIIEKEIRDLISSPKFAITFGVCALLIILTFYVGAARYKLNVSQYEASKSETNRSMEGLTDWFDLENVSAFLPPQPLAALVSGIANDIGRTAHISGRGSIPTEDSRYNEDPIYAIFRFIDLEFVFVVILSLFAILLCYDSISGEKERGTLQLSFANAVPKNIYILGKLIGSLITLIVSIVIALAIGVLILLLMGINISQGEWLRLLLIILSGLLFINVFLNLSIFISTLTHRSANSFLILLVIWVLCVHIIPRASVLMAARSVDVLSVDEISYQKTVLSAQLSEEFREGMSNFMVSSSENHSTDHLKSINDYIDSLGNIRSSKLDELSSRLAEQRQNAQRHQELRAMGIARISPVTSFSLAASNLAGTSTRLKNRFIDEAHNYQKQYGAFIKEKTGMNLGGGIRIKASTDGCGADKKPEPIDPRELPAFNFTNHSMSEVLNAAVIDLGILSIFNLIFFAGAFIAFIRYDVR